ncbi:MAG TPA: hypothetical protein PK435_01250 [Thermoanaerobaculaceae bacterium]|jgi:hypothetical protein|nr:hypothetical protein [Thermoanaerobaculaceae bacterium]
MVAAILRQVVGRESESEADYALVSAFRAQIVRALGEGRWRFADHFCDKLLAEEPCNLEAWLLKGHLAWRHFQDTRAALNCFQRVVILGGFESSNEYVARARSSLAQLLEQLS